VLPLPRARADHRLTTLVVVVAAAIIVAARKPDALLNPQFWAEDGTIFFLQQYERGAAAFLQEYAGYLHLAPRLVALVADWCFPYSAAPAVYNGISLLVCLAAVAAVFSRRLPLDYKPLLALTLVLVPHQTNEVFLNITNVQWLLCVLLILVLLKDRPDQKHGNVALAYAADLLTLALCGLTGPFVLLLIPFFAVRFALERNRYRAGMLAAAVAVASIQSYFVVSHVKLTSGGGISTDWNTYGAILGHKLFGNLFLGEWTYQTSWIPWVAFYAGTLALIAWLALPRNRLAVLLLLGIHFAVLAATVYKFKANPECLIPTVNGPRYFYLPYVTMVWSLVCCLGHWRQKWKHCGPILLMCGALISSLADGFRSDPLVDYDWPTHSQAIGTQEVVIPINPPGWTIVLKPRQSWLR
jgi:hypothetical protein